jgi:hypothetical protein
MQKTGRITITYQLDGGSALSSFEVFAGKNDYNPDFPVKAGETDTDECIINIARTDVLVIVPTVDMTFTLGGVQFERKAGHPIIWTRASRLPCPLKSDATEITVTNKSKEDGALQVRVIENEKPPKPVPQPAITQPAENITDSSQAITQQPPALSLEPAK